MRLSGQYKTSNYVMDIIMNIKRFFNIHQVYNVNIYKCKNNQFKAQDHIRIPSFCNAN